MLRRFHLFFVVILLIGLAAGVMHTFVLFRQRISVPLPAPRLPQKNSAAAETAVSTAAIADPELLNYLAERFCEGDLCRAGSWTEWVILAPDSAWTVEDLQTVRAALITTIGALDGAGLDGRTLLSGYRFRRSPGVYLKGRLGKVAIVRHDSQEILLADGALKKQWGFYIYHELGHVVDVRLDRALTLEFQRLTLGADGSGSGQTADGFWLDRFARERPEEAAADAFALWVILNHTSSPEPVFWMKPEDAHYDAITAVMDQTLRRIAGR